jgi:hypothetical protein
MVEVLSWKTRWGSSLMDPPYWAIFLLIVLCSLAGVVSIVKARRRRERAYYLVSTVAFLMLVAVVVALLNQFLLSLALIVVAGLLSIVSSPKVIDLYGQEMIKQRQETDVSTPLRIRDFLTWKGWIKFNAIYGFRKTMLLYIISNIGVGGAILLTLNILGMINTTITIVYLIVLGFLIIVSHYQIRKAFKQNTLSKD